MSATRPTLARGSIALPYAERQSAAVARLPGAELGWLRRLREQSLARVVAEGVPSPRVERWKYTNLNPLAQAEFEVAGAAGAANEAGTPAAVDLPRFLAEDVAVHRMVFVNGNFRRELSDLADLPAGAAVESLADALARAPQSLAAHFADSRALDGLAALNTALMADGVVFRLAAGTELARPLLLVFLGGSADRAVAFHPRSVIVAEAGSRATIVELHAPASGAGDAGTAYWSQPVTDIVVGDNAELRHYKCQRESLQAYHLAATTVRVGTGGRYDSFALAAGGALARNEVTVTLDGPDASCRLDGGFLARGRQHVDTTTEIIHAKPNTTSHEAFKGVLDGRGRAVFQGLVVVAKDAQKTDGHQSCRTLLLSDGAEIDAKPELEIYADDVKCSHGATVGEIEQDALFYLQARGIPEPVARRMLVEAFLVDVIETIADEAVRDALARVVNDWLADDGTEAAR